MDMRIALLKLKIMLESDPPKSRVLVQRLAVWPVRMLRLRRARNSKFILFGFRFVRGKSAPCGYESARVKPSEIQILSSWIGRRRQWDSHGLYVCGSESASAPEVRGAVDRDVRARACAHFSFKLYISDASFWQFSVL